MAQPVTAILARQGELAAQALRYTRDANEAGLLVNRVMSRAFQSFPEGGSTEMISRAMRGDLDRLIEQLKRTHR